MRRLLVAALAIGLSLGGALPATGTDRDCTPDGVVIEREVPFRNRFGERIAVDLHRPAGVDRRCRFPVVLESSAYRDWTAPQEVDALTEDERRAWWVERGYVFAFADVPGTGASEGAWCLFCEREQRSGVDIVNALGRQRWSNGNVGMIGGSYPGITAMLVAQHRPKHLKAVIAAEFTGDLYDEMLYVDGLPRGEDWQAIAAVFTYIDALSASRDIDFTAIQREHPTDDEWYAERRLRPEDVKVPVYALGGWNDIFDRAVWDTFDRLGSEVKVLRQGPFTHVPVMPQADAWPCADHASDFCGVAFFERHLKGAGSAEYDALVADPVQLYVEPNHGWVELPAKPVTAPWTMALGTAGETAAVRADPTAGATGGRWFARGSVPGTYPPFDYVLGIDGPADQRVEEAKLVSVATPPLERDVTFVGGGTARLRLRSSSPSVDLSVRIVDEWTEHAYRVNGGWRRVALTPGEWTDIEVDLWPIGRRFAAGHRLRIDLAGADVPRFLPPDSPFEIEIDLGASTVTLGEMR